MNINEYLIEDKINWAKLKKDKVNLTPEEHNDSQQFNFKLFKKSI